jgi:hypothetical protein
MDTGIEQKPRGQVLILVALSLLVLFAFVALGVDVGQAYRERRSMQNAADAGALAGAYELCFGDGVTQADREADAITEATDYATTRNGADGAEVMVNAPLTVTVVASKTVSTFFAGLIGFDKIDVDADATAACGKAQAAGLVWPIGFDMTSFPDEQDCGRKVVLWEDGNSDCCSYNCRDYYEYVKQGNQYIFRGKLDVTTENDPGCNNDPPDPMLSGNYYEPQYTTLQGRLWLDISAGLLNFDDPCHHGGCNADELKSRIRGYNNQGETCISWMTSPVCVPGKEGLVNVAWATAGEQEDTIVLIPLYNPYYSEGGPEPCTITTGDPGDSCSSDRYQIEDFGCVRILGSFYFQDWSLSNRKRVIIGEIPCEANGQSHNECGRLLSYTSGEEPKPGDPKAVNLIPTD